MPSRAPTGLVYATGASDSDITGHAPGDDQNLDALLREQGAHGSAQTGMPPRSDTRAVG